MICDGCNVRGGWEHRCHGAPCPCEECREADRLFGHPTALEDTLAAVRGVSLRDAVAEAMARAMNANPTVWDREPDGTWRYRSGLSESVREAHRHAATDVLAVVDERRSSHGPNA
jgi:hypothetical protein